MFEDLTSEERKSLFVGGMFVCCSAVIAYRLGKAAGSVETTRMILGRASDIVASAQVPVMGMIR